MGHAAKIQLLQILGVIIIVCVKHVMYVAGVNCPTA
jgi:hypothetical protein